MSDVGSPSSLGEPDQPAPPVDAPDAHAPDADARRPRSRSRLLIVAIVGTIVVLFAGYVGLSFLGSQVEEALRGTIEMGTETGSGCSVSSSTSSFSADDTLYFAVHLAREVPAGEIVTVRLLQDGAELESTARTFEESGTCLTGSVPASGFDPGHYRLEYLAGSEQLASGEFDIGT